MYIYNIIMYDFVIGAFFKNESHIIKEWIEHYFHHGVDHIYLWRLSAAVD